MLTKFISVLLLAQLVVSADVVVNTTSGVVKGLALNVLGETVNQFMGIPFAEPPVGDLRFGKPKAITKPLSDVIDGTITKTSCMQNDLKIPISEDCLFLNVWTKTLVTNTSDTKLKPVMYWIYGGGLRSGSSFEVQYNGSVLATYDVVYVSVNYRLGKFGFLYGGDESAPGNVGLYDQVLGLKWVRDNIHLFGGDKNQITIFGESAGSMSVSALLISPEATGLFKRGILQSGAFLSNKDRPPLTKEEALKEAKDIAKHFNCTDDKEWLSCLRKVDAKELSLLNMGTITAVHETDFLPYTAQKAFQMGKFNKDLELIAGICKDEMAGSVAHKTNLTKKDFEDYVKQQGEKYKRDIDIDKVDKVYLDGVDLQDSDQIKWKISDFLGDTGIKCSTYRFAKGYAQHSANNQSIYFYELTYSAKPADYVKDYGISHATDIDFMWGLFRVQKDIPKINVEFSEEVVDYWTSFAKTGKPNKWRPLLPTSASGPTLVKDLKPHTSNEYFTDLFAETCDGLWSDWF